MEIQFSRAGRPGRVQVSCELTCDPATEGAFPGAKGLPHMTARVEYAGSGYDALFGWVQLVRSTDNDSGGRDFEMDPFALFPDVPSPYCFFGFSPTLFDGPARDSRRRMGWLAHSFLAYSPLEAVTRQVVPLLGFSWGFEIDDRAEVTVRSVDRLQGTDWTAHADLLETTYPDWRFAASFG